MKHEICKTCGSIIPVQKPKGRRRVKNVIIGVTRRCPKCEAQLPRVPDSFDVTSVEDIRA